MPRRSGLRATSRRGFRRATPIWCNETQLRAALSSLRGVNVTALAIAGDFIYTGMQNGDDPRFRQSRIELADVFFGAAAGAVERFWVDPQDPRVALAALGAAPDDPFRTSAPAHVLHTVNGGAFWDNFTANLPDAAAHGVAADPASGALYAATDRGVFMAYADLSALGAVQTWTAVPGLPDGAAMDVKLDAQANQLWAAIDGYGVYSTLAPHRLRDPSVVSAADMIARAVAPGSLVSILGAQVDSVRAGGVAAPVLAATGSESQIQIPFEVRGDTLSLAASFAGNRREAAVAAAGRGRAGDLRGARRLAHAARCRQGRDAGCDDGGALRDAHSDSGYRAGARDAGVAHGSSRAARKSRRAWRATCTFTWTARRWK